MVQSNLQYFYKYYNKETKSLKEVSPPLTDPQVKRPLLPRIRKIQTETQSQKGKTLPNPRLLQVGASLRHKHRRNPQK